MCSSVCSGFSHLISLPCRICCEGTRFGCDALCRALTSPFFPYLAVTCALNLPPSVWGIQSAIQGCHVDWLTFNGIATAIHILAAFYIVQKIQAENWDDDEGSAVVVPTTGRDPEKGNQPTTVYQKVTESKTVTSSGIRASMSSFYMRSTTSSDGRANSLPRLIQVLCYDVGVAVYIIIFLAWMIWISIGASHMFGGVVDEWEGCASVGKWVRNSVILGWVYMMLVCCSFCCSMICIRPF